MPYELKLSRWSTFSSRLKAVHDRCGATPWRAPQISTTVSSVPSRRESPEPMVSEKKRGLNSPSCWQVMCSFFLPSSVLGGKISKLKSRPSTVDMSVAALAGDQQRQPPRDQAVQQPTEDSRSQPANLEALQQAADAPEKQPVQHEVEDSD